MYEHREGIGSSFTKKYGVTKLVWYETGDWYDGARAKEKAMKTWKRAWKIRVIEEKNPDWEDLYPTLT